MSLAGRPHQATRSFHVWPANPFDSAGPFSWPTAKQTRSLGASPASPSSGGVRLGHRPREFPHRLENPRDSRPLAELLGCWAISGCQTSASSQQPAASKPWFPPGAGFLVIVTTATELRSAAIWLHHRCLLLGT